MIDNWVKIFAFIYLIGAIVCFIYCASKGMLLEMFVSLAFIKIEILYLERENE